MIWHSATVDEVARELGTDKNNGLQPDEAGDRLDSYGYNLEENIDESSFWHYFFTQMRDPVTMLLLLAACGTMGVSIYRKSNFWIEAIIIVAIVVFNFVIGFLYKHIADRWLNKLKKIAAPMIKVKRGGEVVKIKTSELVPGDVLIIEKGDIVPADARIIFQRKLVCNDSAVTGNNMPAQKRADLVLPQNTPLLNRVNTVYAGSIVTSGSARAIVTETGTRNEIFRVKGKRKANGHGGVSFEKRLKNVEKVLSIVAVIAFAAYAAVGIFVERLPETEVVTTAAALAVSIVPESLSVITSIVLAVSFGRMYKRNAYLKNFEIIDSLKDTTVICTNKTSALTSLNMTVRKAWAQSRLAAIDEENLGDITVLLKLGALCCDARCVKMKDTGEKKYFGDPMEVALITAAENVGYNKNTLENTLPRLGEIPFDPKRKFMATVNIIGGRDYIIAKGAPEVIFERCAHGSLKRARSVAKEMAAGGLSVIAVAYRETGNLSELNDPQKLSLAGVIGIEDPAHNDVLEAVDTCRKMGIKPVMITGDNHMTAESVGGELGILRDGDEVVTGAQMAGMPDDELMEKLERISVYARVSPDDKLRIVRLWKKKKATVAVTGLRLSDVKAMEEADIACALGKYGREAVKGASDVILSDDSFATIVEAVRYSRSIFDNMKKTLRFLLGCNLGELIAVFSALVAGMGVPITAVQLLWINLVTDSFPAIALAAEKPEPVRRECRINRAKNRKETLFNGTIGFYAVLEGIMFGALTVGAYMMGRFVLSDGSVVIGRTMAFVVLAFSQIIHSFNVRSKLSLFKTGLFSNPPLIGAAVLSVLLTLAVMFTPLREIFGISMLSGGQWKWVAVFSVVPAVVLEIAKAIRYSVRNRQEERACRRLEAEKDGEKEA